jgi:hypothetical protein
VGVEVGDVGGRELAEHEAHTNGELPPGENDQNEGSLFSFSTDMPDEHLELGNALLNVKVTKSESTVKGRAVDHRKGGVPVEA